MLRALTKVNDLFLARAKEIHYKIQLERPSVQDQLSHVVNGCKVSTNKTKRRVANSVELNALSVSIICSVSIDYEVYAKEICSPCALASLSQDVNINVTVPGFRNN